jgi:hypothetical protein
MQGAGMIELRDDRIVRVIASVLANGASAE